MRKRILIPLVGVGLLLLLAGGVLLYLDRLGAAALERGGSAMMGVPTTVDEVSLRPFAGKASVAGLTIGNPAGFETPHFMAVRGTAVDFPLGNVFEKTVEVPSIEIDGVDVNLEKSRKGANYEVILENMKKGEKEPAPEEPGKKFVVRKIRIRDVAVRADIAIAGEPVSHVDLTIPEIELTDVGSDTTGGMVMSQLMGTIVKATLTAIVTQGARVLPQTVVNGLGVGLKGLAGLGTSGLRVVGKVTGTVGGKAIEVVEGGAAVVGEGAKAIGKGAKGIAEGIGGLLGGSKDEEEEEK